MVSSSCSRYDNRHRRGGAASSYQNNLTLAGHCLAALAVILSFMADTKHVVLIHGSWSRGEQLAPVRAAFEERPRLSCG